MKLQSPWLKAICIICIPFALYNLYEFGYSVVNKAFIVRGISNNLDHQTISVHSINYSELIFTGIIISLLFVVLYYALYPQQKKWH